MNTYAVMLYTSDDVCWVEIINAGVQEGPDQDCKTRRHGLCVARKECKRLGLTSFCEVRTHEITGGPR